MAYHRHSSWDELSRDVTLTLLRALFSRRGALAVVTVLVFLYLLLHSFPREAQTHPGRSGKVPAEHEFPLKLSTTKPQDQSESKTLDQEQLYAQRKTLYEEVCSKDKSLGHVGDVFMHPPSALAVCHVPKTGCTFWKRVFRFLYKDYGKKDVKSMFDIDRLYVHFAAWHGATIHSYRTPEGKVKADASYKVLFTRDPYKRLWSGYVDKFLLPDSWSDHGRVILGARKPRQPKVCPDDVMFEEFLVYTLRNKDSHWRPVSDVCSPCLFQPHLVGHMETFGQDTQYVLRRQGLGELLEGHHHDNHVEDEIRIMVDYHYGLYKERRFIQGCLTPVQLAVRLWKVFQLNGYIGLDRTFPLAEVQKSIEGLSLQSARDKVIEIFIGRYREHPTSKVDWESQREGVIAQAYRNVSQSVKEKIAQNFKNDFALFGYKPEPPG